MNRPSDAALARLARVSKPGDPAHYIAADRCDLCGGTGKGEYDYGTRQHDKCALCLGRAYLPVEYTVEARCSALGGCEGRTCACEGDGWRSLRVRPHELVEMPNTVGSAWQRAEAEELVAAIEWAEAQGAGEEAA